MTDFVDPYLDPETGILRNLVNAKTIEELEQAEADLVLASEFELLSETKILQCNPDLLCRIHKILFGKIYDFAGKYRTVDIRKNVENSEFFLICGKTAT